MFLSADRVLDGYRLIKEIGSGGFGVVWLCRNDAIGEFHALKWIPRSTSLHLERELEGLEIYRQGIRKHHRHFLPIGHIRLVEDGLFYVMPLADGPAGVSPESENWYPLTLATLMERKRQEGAWLSSSEIKSYVCGLLEAVNCLSEAALLHRDIKPENIIFFQDELCLSDYGLVTLDRSVVSRKGSPAYLAPSWYIESGGNPDMWACACVLYTLLTGNQPDKMGRAAFRWPPQGETSLSAEEKMEWIRLQSIAYRATAENSEERFLDFSRFSAAVSELTNPKKKRFGQNVRFALLGAITVAGFGLYYLQRHSVSLDSSIKAIEADTPAEPLVTAPASMEVNPRSEKTGSNLVQQDEAIPLAIVNASTPRAETATVNVPLVTAEATPKLHTASGEADSPEEYWTKYGSTVAPRWDGQSYFIRFQEQLYISSASTPGGGLLIVRDKDMPGPETSGFKLSGLRGKYRLFLGMNNIPQISNAIHTGNQRLMIPIGQFKHNGITENRIGYEVDMGVLNIERDQTMYMEANGTIDSNNPFWEGLEYLRFEPLK